MRAHPRPLLVLLALSGCGPQVVDEGRSLERTAEGLRGCRGKASSAVPPSGRYFLTTFGVSRSDDGIMSCGTYTRTGSWYYAASRQRYGCGSAVQVRANGRCVVARTDDYGPDVCVENAVGGPILDVSPLVSRHLFGVSSAGWSDRLVVEVSQVPAATPLGPCADGGGPVAPPPEPREEDSCSSSTLARQVPPGTCVQSASDAKWYRCGDGAWTAGATSCAQRFAWCHSSTLGRAVPPRTCVESRADRRWYQCSSTGWAGPVADGAGPIGPCAAEHAL